jgi:hypothetical protein
VSAQRFRFLNIFFELTFQPSLKKIEDPKTRNPHLLKMLLLLAIYCLKNNNFSKLTIVELWNAKKKKHIK